MNDNIEKLNKKYTGKLLRVINQFIPCEGYEKIYLGDIILVLDICKKDKSKRVSMVCLSKTKIVTDWWGEDDFDAYMDRNYALV
jgi:hypothetical protein